MAPQARGILAPMAPPPSPALPADTAPCPCDLGAGGRRYADCCGRYHGAGCGQAPDAASLMRSRYSAFVLGRHAELLATWHPDTRPATLEADPPGLRWLGLSVKAARSTGPEAAEVEFIARSKLGGRAHRLHERSRFLRVDGRWLYLDGTDPANGGPAGAA